MAIEEKEYFISRFRELGYIKTMSEFGNSEDLIESWNKLVLLAEKAGMKPDEIKNIWNEYKWGE